MAIITLNLPTARRVTTLDIETHRNRLISIPTADRKNRVEVTAAQLVKAALQEDAELAAHYIRTLRQVCDDLRSADEQIPDSEYHRFREKHRLHAIHVTTCVEFDGDSSCGCSWVQCYLDGIQSIRSSTVCGTVMSPVQRTKCTAEVHDILRQLGIHKG